MSATEATTDLAFAAAYDRLKEITTRLSSDTENEIDPDQLLELLAEGKGLEIALRQRLDEVEQQIRQIESGEGIRAYRIVAADAGGAVPDVAVDTNDFAQPHRAAAAPSDDDIPF